jgi:hypothetical protein
VAKISGRALGEHLSRVTAAHARVHREPGAAVAAQLAATREAQNAPPNPPEPDDADHIPPPPQ